MKTMVKGLGVAIFTAMLVLALAVCSDPASNKDGSESGSPGGSLPGNSVINIAAIQGVVIPATGGTPVTAITGNAQYSGTVAWNGNPSTFAASTVYTAAITLTAKTGYTLQGVAANFFTVAGAASVSNSANSGVVTVTFPATTPNIIPVINPTSVNISITAPVKGETPSTTASDAASGEGHFTIDSVSWSPDDNPFLGGTVYTVLVTLTVNSGYNFLELSSAAVNGQSAEMSNNTGSAVTLSHTFPATNEKTVSGIKIKTQPSTLTYTHGDTLDLAGLVVTLSHDDTTTEDVAAANFTDNNITASPAAGDNLVYSTHNGHPVTITYGSLTCNTGNLTINKATFTAAPVLTLTAGNRNLVYTWTNSNPAADSYDIYWKAGNNLSAADVKTGTRIPGATSGGTISGLTNGTAYSVLVTADKAGYNAVDSTVQTGTPPVNAVQPVISAQPQGGSFLLGKDTVSVTASVTDGGTLSYQWYRNNSNSAVGGTTIAGATNSSFVLSDEGTYYCYVIVTNTITNNGDGGTKTAQTTSSVAAVTVQPQVMAEWARTVSGTSSFFTSQFNAVAVDSSGNVYAAGTQRTGTYTYGTGVSAAGSGSGSFVALVKYNSSGTAQWARTVDARSNVTVEVEFNAVAVDSSGNVYAAGYQNNYYDDETFTYGTGVSVQGNYSAVLVKYNSSGTAQWARTAERGSSFKAVAVDSSGNVYAAGRFDLVKYDSNGTVQWTQSVIGSSSGDDVGFNAVAVDSSGNVYAAGTQRESTYTYGTGVSATGTSANSYYAVLVKYDSNGTAQWAQTVIGASEISRFHAVAVDSSGSVYAAGIQSGNGTYTYGTGVSATGTADASYPNVVLVKYDSSGTALWARTNSAGGRYPSYLAVAVDSSGSVYAAGYQSGNATYTYGTGVSAQGTYSAINGNNVVLVKYDSGGTALWARSVSQGNNDSQFNAVAADSSGNVYAAGYQGGNGPYTYGTGVSAQGTSASYLNVVLVKYRN